MSSVVKDLSNLDGHSFLNDESIFSGSAYNCSSKNCKGYFCDEGCFKYYCSGCRRGTNRLMGLTPCPTQECINKRKIIEDEKRRIEAEKEVAEKEHERLMDVYNEELQKWSPPIIYPSLITKCDGSENIPNKNAMTVKSDWYNLSKEQTVDRKIIVPVSYETKRNISVGFPEFSENKLLLGFWKKICYNDTTSWIYSKGEALLRNGELSYEDKSTLEGTFLEKHYDKVLKDVISLKKIVGEF